MDKKTETIYQIRKFNRFYTVLLGLLDRNFLDSNYSVTETRILFELKDLGECTANDLVEKLHIDKSYLSRILKRFQDKDLLIKQISKEDARSYELELTEAGHAVTEKLIEKSNTQIGLLLQFLNEEECMEICQSMKAITKHLSKNGGLTNV